MEDGWLNIPEYVCRHGDYDECKECFELKSVVVSADGVEEKYMMEDKFSGEDKHIKSGSIHSVKKEVSKVKNITNGNQTKDIERQNKDVTGKTRTKISESSLLSPNKENVRVRHMNWLCPSMCFFCPPSLRSSSSASLFIYLASSFIGSALVLAVAAIVLSVHYKIPGVFMLIVLGISLMILVCFFLTIFVRCVAYLCGYRHHDWNETIYPFGKSKRGYSIICTCGDTECQKKREKHHG